MNQLQRLCAWILRTRYPLAPIVLGLLLTLPSLWLGLQMDDYTIRSVVLSVPVWGGEMPRSPWEAFDFVRGDAKENAMLMDRGVMPWWCDPHCRLSFMRPLTTLTHMVDFRLWDDRPWLMHLQSLVWFALMIWAAAALYRRLIGRTMPSPPTPLPQAGEGNRCGAVPWIAALAALMFALDDARGCPVGWLANRNELLAGVFGFAALIAHDRWRRDGWRPGAWLAPLALLAGLLSKESAVCTLGYLAAYAIFLESGRWRGRLATLLPCLLTGAAWYVAYKALGYGASGSTAYVDPGSDPLHYLRHVIDHVPILLLGQWGLPASDLSVALSTSAFAIYWWVAVAFLGVLAVLLGPLIARDALARFWTLGMFLSLLPACATFPGDRLLTFAGLGAMGLLAEWLGGLQQGAAWLPRWRLWRPAAKIVAWPLLVVHLILAPLLLPLSVGTMARLGRGIEPFVATMPSDPRFAGQTAVFVNTSWFANLAVIQTCYFRGRPIPQRVLNLTSSCPSATLTRTGPNTLVVRPQGGYLPLRDWSAEPGKPAAVAIGNVFRLLDLVVRSDTHPMPLGYKVSLSYVTIEITALTEDGRPAEATFRFNVPLEDPSLRWLQVSDKACVPFPLPGIGETATVVSPLRHRLIP